ncbi:hypothetical protein Ana3638_14335 [Anaerocolumna sedimenticola]|uniref:Uncharacterized protein n=1 Tax=Anaerocolumna sedimenticola TaxID=2696063 RepID=A0A6P1TQV7_9FIRM|nr:hypothetical protein [Anaerocolumna sedimenticola]QHQ61808.1 hypothetical protein Ana3638_14335 [Anaerocolumna sedimenticola]
MLSYKLPDIGYSMLIVIVSRGKGSKVLDFVKNMGALEASCFYGRGTVKNNVLQLVELNDVNKEIVLFIIHSEEEEEILRQINLKFHLDKPNQGIAFTTSLAAFHKMKSDAAFKYNTNSYSAQKRGKYTALLIIMDKGKADSVIEISQKAGYYGGTIVKARGMAGKLNIILDKQVEPEKEAVLMLTENKRAYKLASLLTKHFKLKQPNTGILVMFELNRTLGLFQT